VSNLCGSKQVRLGDVQSPVGLIGDTDAQPVQPERHGGVCRGTCTISYRCSYPVLPVSASACLLARPPQGLGSGSP
jgi:hypothetical protein